MHIACGERKKGHETIPIALPVLFCSRESSHFTSQRQLS